MNTNAQLKHFVRGTFIIAAISFAFGTGSLSAHADNGLSPVIAVHKSKLLSSQFVKSSHHAVQSSESILAKSAIQRRFSSSKLLSSRLIKSSQSTHQANGAYSHKTHTAKPHRKL